MSVINNGFTCKDTSRANGRPLQLCRAGRHKYLPTDRTSIHTSGGLSRRSRIGRWRFTDLSHRHTMTLAPSSQLQTRRCARARSRSVDEICRL